MDIIYNENLWTVGHFLMWMFVGRYLLKSWVAVIILSIILEAFEYYVPYDIAKEVWHLPSNPGKVNAHILEIQRGEQCIEEDIERRGVPDYEYDQWHEGSPV